LVGYYFNFYAEHGDLALGTIYWADQTYNIDQMRNGAIIWTGEIKIWTLPAGSAVDEGGVDSYGRKHPKEDAAEMDWEIGDLFCFEQRKINYKKCFLLWHKFCFLLPSLHMKFHT